MQISFPETEGEHGFIRKYTYQIWLLINSGLQASDRYNDSLLCVESTRKGKNSHACFPSLFRVDIQSVFVAGMILLFCHEREYQRLFPQTENHRFPVVPIHHKKTLHVFEDMKYLNNEDLDSNQVYLMNKI